MREDEDSDWSTAPTARGWWPLFLVGLAVTAAPLAISPFPPLLDYPNHLARLWLIQGGIKDPMLARAYAIDWHSAFTNILIDLTARASAGLVPTALLGPLLLAAALLLPALGIVMLARVLHGRLSWWHLACVALCWSHVFLLGFINFQISLGLALLAAAGEQRFATRTGWAVPWRVACGAVLLLAHAFGLLFYAALVAALAIGPSWPAGLRGWSHGLGRALVAVLPLVVLVVLFWALAAHPMDTRSGPPSPTRWQSRWIVGHGAPFLDALRGYRPWFDVGAGLALLAVPLVALCRRRLKVHAGLIVAIGVLFAGGMVMPRYLFGTALIALRLPTMVWFALPVALMPLPGRSRRLDYAPPLFALLLVLGRAAWFAAVWHDRAADLEALQRALVNVPPGARLLPLMQAPGNRAMNALPVGRAIGHQLTGWHLPALAVIERHAFVPTLFASPGRHVLRVRPPFDRISVAEGAIPTVDKLFKPLSPRDQHEFGYLNHWRCFDFVLVLNADVPNAAGPLRPSPDLLPVADEGFAKLYRISRGQSPREAPRQ